MTIAWLRFTWDLQSLPDSKVEPPSSYALIMAEKDDEPVIEKVTGSAFSMDTGWGDIQRTIVERMVASVNHSFEKDSKTQCLILKHGHRVIGSSVILADESAEVQLLTGPCILHEYRSRGLGSLLLQASLAALRSAGLKKASGFTREKTTAARYIYPKFGGTSTPWTPDFAAPPKIAA